MWTVILGHGGGGEFDWAGLAVFVVVSIGAVLLLRQVERRARSRRGQSDERGTANGE